MELVFGLELDGPALPLNAFPEGGIAYLGPQGLLRTLENHLGLSGHPTDNEYLRIEAFRQLLIPFLADEPQAFFADSFAADQFATAADLLGRRDELLLNGWDFPTASDLPDRLHTLAQLEARIREKRIDLPPGFADRYRRVMSELPRRPHPFRKIQLREPERLLPQYLRRLLRRLQETAPGSPELAELPLPAVEGSTDLQRFQQILARGPEQKNKTTLKADGSLLLLRAPSGSLAAGYLAQLFRRNPAFRPVCLLPEKNRTLDDALVQEGLPSLGIQSASLARPSLQILKLVTAFLWDPVDPYKVLEFVSLPVKPLADDLATLLAGQMARTPGIRSEEWTRNVFRYFDQLNERAAYDRSVDPRAVRDQYEFWFERQRYPVDQTVPKEEVSRIFRYLQRWAVQAYDEDNSRGASLLVLSEQAKRIGEILETLPEPELTQLELERIVRTIYEPSPVVFQEAELGHLSYVYHPGGLTRSVDRLLWWNFVQNEPVYFFSRWYRQELDRLQQADACPDPPQLANDRLQWYRALPFLLAREQVVLVIPEQLYGENTNPHPLFGDLEAAFSNPEEITLDLEQASKDGPLARLFQYPPRKELPFVRLGRPQPFLQIDRLKRVQLRPYETYSSLETLFYYPYQWVFRYQIRLRKSSILSVVKDETLMGNLAHRFFQLLLREDFYGWDKPGLERWTQRQAADLLAREGAVLLLYGKEPERVAFVNHLQYAAWSLVSLLQQNDWKVRGTELALEGAFDNTPLRGIADLVLERTDELALVDLKWRGAGYRERVIKNEEDLQLALYARLLAPEGGWIHTAYFIINRGKMLARNNRAFQSVIPIAPESDPDEIYDRIWRRMETTYRWRRRQLDEGQIEIRCAHTLPDLDEAYADLPPEFDWMDLLEMKTEDSRFDDYRTLINLVE